MDSFEFSSLPGVKFELQDPGWFSGFALMANGQTLKPKGKYINYTSAEGREFKIEIKRSGLDLHAPTFILEGESVTPREPLPGWQVAFAAIPLLLIGIGGAIGGAVGAITWGLNLKLLRAKQPLPLRLVFCLLSAGGAAIAYFALAMLFGLLLGR